MNLLKPAIYTMCLTLLFPGFGLATSVGLNVEYVVQPSISEVSVFVLPNGSGMPLTQATLFGGQVVDSTVEIRITDDAETPIANFPRQDLWLESEEPGVDGCFLYFEPDANTDANGVTKFSNTFAAGGWTEGPFRIMVSGARASYLRREIPPILIRMNSADINADGRVNLSDVVDFAYDFFGGYNYRSDFVWDGVIDLTDLARFAQSLGRDCPYQ